MAVPLMLGDRFEFGPPEMLFEGDYLEGFSILGLRRGGRRLVLDDRVRPRRGRSIGWSQINIILNWF